MAEFPGDGVPRGDDWRKLWEGAMEPPASDARIPDRELLSGEPQTPLEIADDWSWTLSSGLESRFEALGVEAHTTQFHEVPYAGNWMRVAFLKKPFALPKHTRRIVVTQHLGTFTGEGESWEDLATADYVVDPTLRRLSKTDANHEHFIGAAAMSFPNAFPPVILRSPVTGKMYEHASPGYYLHPAPRLPAKFNKSARVKALELYNDDVRGLIAKLALLSGDTLEK